MISGGWGERERERERDRETEIDRERERQREREREREGNLVAMTNQSLVKHSSICGLEQVIPLSQVQQGIGYGTGAKSLAHNSLVNTKIWH